MSKKSGRVANNPASIEEYDMKSVGGSVRLGPETCDKSAMTIADTRDAIGTSLESMCTGPATSRRAS